MGNGGFDHPQILDLEFYGNIIVNTHTVKPWCKRG
jgi:hypothetical protein